MATKVQQMQRFENAQDRPRRLPTVERIEAPRSGGLPAVPINWYPKQSNALMFADKLLGTAKVATALAETEAGKQYKEAQSRAMRGDFTIDDSGLFTFTKEQQRALSEVEGKLDADKAFNTLMQESEKWKQDLAADGNLSPAQRVAIFTERVRAASFGQLDNTKDSDYIRAKGSDLHRRASSIIDNYLHTTVGTQLQREEDMTGQVFHNALRDMPTGLSGQEEADYRIMALREFQYDYNKITGKPFSAAKRLIAPMIQDLVVSGDVDTLERIKDAEMLDGSTLAGMGMISKATLESANDNAVRAEERKLKRESLTFEENYRVYGSQASALYGRTLMLSKLSGEDKMSEIAKIEEETTALIQTLQGLPEGVLDPDKRNYLMGNLKKQQDTAAAGGPKDIMPKALQDTIRELLPSDTDAAMRLIREYPQYELPPELQRVGQAAWSYKDTESRQVREHTLWGAEVLDQVKRPPTDPLNPQRWTASEEYKTALRVFEQTAIEVEKEFPEMGLEARKAETEKRFFTRYEKETPDVRSERMMAETVFDISRNASGERNPVEIASAVAQFPSMDDVNRNELVNSLELNGNLSAEQKRTLLSVVASKSDVEFQEKLNGLVTTRESLETLSKADPLQPRQFFGKHGNDLFVPLTPVSDHRVLIVEKTAKGGLRVVEKALTDMTSSDVPAVGPYPRDAKVVINGKVVPVSSLDNWGDFAWLDKEAEPISSDPRVPIYNPKGYPDGDVPRPTGRYALFHGNFTNREKPLEDHMLDVPLSEREVRLSGSGGGLYRYIAGKFAKPIRYGDCTPEQRQSALTPPYDPELVVLTKGGEAIKLKNFVHKGRPELLSSTPVNLMSTKQQIQLLSQ